MRKELTPVLVSSVLAMTGCMTLSANKQLAQPELPAQSAALFDKALGHEAAGDLSAARAAYSELLELVPQHPQACHHLAILLDREGRFSESDTLYQRAIESHENRAEVLADYAYSQYVRGDEGMAEATLQIALAENRTLKRAHNNLGLVLASQGREKEALAQFALGGCSQKEAISNYENVRRWKLDPALAQAQVKGEAHPSGSATTAEPMVAAKNTETAEARSTDRPLVPAVATDENQSHGNVRRVRYQPTVALSSESKIETASRSTGVEPVHTGANQPTVQHAKLVRPKENFSQAARNTYGPSEKADTAANFYARMLQTKTDSEIAVR